eukprot:2778836-Karenia_brevis.AAC.1
MSTRAHEHVAPIPQGNPAPRPTPMTIKPEEWLQGPHGMMGLGDMLDVAGYTVDRDDWVPPPPSAPIL